MAKRVFRFIAAALVALACTGAASALEPRRAVKLRALDKITGNSIDLTANVGETIHFKSLSVTVRSCQQAPPEDTPESAAYLEIATSTPLEKIPLGKRQGVEAGKRNAAKNEPQQIFSGWMFASSPGLNALEHPTYDVWVISCIAS